MTTTYNILIAEDEPNIATALQAILKKGIDGSTITVTSNGKDALESLLDKDFDLIISDWNMPIMTGDELLASIRSNERLKHLPFMMLTARGDKDSVISAMKSGVTKYITKPFEKKIIISKAKELLSSQHLNELDHVTNTLDSQPTSQNEEKEEDVIPYLVNRLKNGDIEFPVMPEIGMRAAELIKNEDISIEDLTNLITQDAALTSRLISIANSPIYNTGNGFNSIEDAIIRIGLRDVSNLIVAISNKSLFKKAGGIFDKKLNALWVHSFATGSCAKIIGKKIGVYNPDRMFSMGLLHDIGKLVLLSILFPLSKKREIAENDLDIMLNQLHVTFGKAVIERWKMPTDFINVITNHHNIENMAELPKETQAVSFANILVRKLDHSLVADDGANLAESELAKILNLDEKSIDKILEQTKKYVGLMKSAI